MSKTRFTFLVIGLVYLLIALFSVFPWLEISENILFGLSLTSLLISIGDTIDKLAILAIYINLFEFTLYITSDYLTQRINENMTKFIKIDVYNIRLGLDNLRFNINEVPQHPADFQSRMIFSVAYRSSQCLFLAGIASFIFIPFLNFDFYINGISRILTICAFAFMCINIFLGDMQQHYFELRNNCELDKHTIIEDSYPGFKSYYVFRMEHNKAYNEQKQAEETARYNDETSENTTNHGDTKEEDNTEENSEEGK